MPYTPAQLKKATALLDLLEPERNSKAVGFKHDLSPAAGVAPYGHGYGGLFSQPGQDSNVFSAIMLPQMGLMDELPVMPAGTSAPPEFGGAESPMFTTVTGVTQGAMETWANQPNGICDPAPEGGLMKVCTVTAPYGRISECMRAIELDRIGSYINRSEPADLRIMNPVTPQGRSGGGVLPMLGLAGNPLNIEVQRRMFEAFVSFKRLLAPLVWTGTPAANKAGGGAAQWIGMETWVNSGNHRDAISGAVCTALDADIKQFGCSMVNGTARSIVQYLDTIFGYLEHKASRQGLNPVDWAIVMRPELFDEVVKVWPVEQHLWALQEIAQYTNGRVMIDASDATNARMDMLTNLFLPVRGKRRRVILDDGIPEEDITNNGALLAGQYCSDIYVIPLSVLGGVPVTYWEAYNFDNGNLREALELVQSREAVWTTDGGRFLMYTRRTETCLNLCWRVRPRIVMRTPFLSARIVDVGYQPLQHFASPFPASPYFTDGGVSNRAIGTYYTEWNGATPTTLPS